MVDNNYELLHQMQRHILGDRMTVVALRKPQVKAADELGTHAPGAITYYSDYLRNYETPEAHYEPMLREETTVEKQSDAVWGTYVPLLLVGGVLGYLYWRHFKREVKTAGLFSLFSQ